MAFTGTDICQAGEITVEFQTLGSVSTIEIIDIGDLEYSMDISDESATTIDTVSQFVARLPLTLYNVASDDTLVSDALDALTTSTKVKITLSRGGTDYEFWFETEPYEYDVDELAETITIDLKASTGYGSAGSPSTTNVDANASGGPTLVAMVAPANAIAAGLAGFGASTTVVRSTTFSQTSFPSSPDPNYMFAFLDTVDYRDILAPLARVSGAIYGVGFSEGWFVSRSDTTSPVTLDAVDDIIGNPKRKKIYPDLKTVNLDFDNVGFDSNLSVASGKQFNLGDTETIRSGDDTVLSIDENESYIGVVEYNTSNANARSIKSSPLDANTNNLFTGLFDEGFLNYCLALRGLDTALTTVAPEEVDLQVYDVLSIKPYEPFQITDSTGKLSEFTSKTWRPSKITYSFMDNTVRINAYRIA